MRKESKQIKQVTMERVQAYHNGDYSPRSQAYAFDGFASNKYFTSDRFIGLDASFRRPDGQPLQGFGLEIEMECRAVKDSNLLAEIMAKVVFSHFPADLFKMQHDGSLGDADEGYDSSVECITQVMTKAFIRNNYRNFKLLYDTYLPGISASCTTGRCGMHVNISNAVFGKTEKAQEEAIRKLYYIVNKYFELCCKLFNRTGTTVFCRQMNYAEARTMNVHGVVSNHHVCFNLGHYDAGRIEIRLVGGQKNFACFRNTMESVFFLCERVRKLSWADCDNLQAIFQGCNQYVYDRLESRCSDYIPHSVLQAIAGTVIREELL